ncbi:hypothetical protein GQ53DRAFT_755628 [Thozetella sp. PMI_491]|nr:hypothetical protein GQ53DRAFT_755628 [Thozetella sp. PMI_491]
MTTLDDALKIQKQYGVLQAPTSPQIAQSAKLGTAEIVAATSSTLQVALVNNTTSSNVWAYVSGLDINNNSAVFLLQSDGKSIYYPSSPSSNGQPLQANCHIRLGGPGSTTTVTIPQAAGGRIWFCKDNQLTFLLNPGPGLVEPSASNISDPNYNFMWSFAEFTFNSFQIFSNITYVDFASLPIALKLQNTSGQTFEVKGMSSTALDTICQQLIAQSAKDGAGWKDLVITGPSGANLRALSPVKGMAMNSSLFNGYYQPYVNAVWSKYASTSLSIDTQVEWGVQQAQVSNGVLNFPGVASFAQPSAADIFNCNSGPFADTSGEIGNIGARLAAAFNRSTLLIDANQPTGEQVSQYYQDSITNHYSRIIHSVNDSGLGYAFPYDDVAPNDASNVDGAVADSNPTLLTISVGGGNVTTRSVDVREMARSGGRSRQLVGGRRFRRGLDWLSAEDEKALLAQRETGFVEPDTDLEQGILPAKLKDEVARLPAPVTSASVIRPLQSLLPTALKEKMVVMLERVEGSAAYAYAKPAVDAVVKAVIMFLSLGFKTVVSRVVMVVLLLLCSFLLGFFGRPEGALISIDSADPSA